MRVCNCNGPFYSYVLSYPQSSRVLKFPKSEMLAGEKCKCSVFFVPEAPKNCKGSGGMLPRKIV